MCTLARAYTLFKQVEQTLLCEKPNEWLTIVEYLLNAPTCAICLDEIETGVRIKRCRHVFHRECIFNWVSNSPTHTVACCPECRSEIP